MELSTLCSSTDFFLFNLEQLILFGKVLKPGSHLPFGPLYPAFTFFQEIVTLLILVAVVWAFYRRYIEKLVRLKRGWKSGLVLIFIGGLMLSVLIGNGMGMIWHGHEATWTEPVASAFATIFGWLPEVSCDRYFLCHVVDSFTNSY